MSANNTSVKYDLLKATSAYKSLTWHKSMTSFNLWQLFFMNMSYIVLHVYFKIGGLYQVLYATFWILKNVFKVVV